MKTIRITTSDWLETEFSVSVIQATPQTGKEHRLKTDNRRVSQKFANYIASIARVETNTMLIVPAA
jgi:uncharacterized protein YfaT (DUF1175 family)